MDGTFSEWLRLIIAIPIFYGVRFLATYASFFLGQWAHDTVNSWWSWVILPLVVTAQVFLFAIAYNILFRGGFSVVIRWLSMLAGATCILIPITYYKTARWPVEIGCEIFVVLYFIWMAVKQFRAQILLMQMREGAIPFDLELYTKLYREALRGMPQTDRMDDQDKNDPK